MYKAVRCGGYAKDDYGRDDDVFVWPATRLLVGILSLVVNALHCRNMRNITNKQQGLS